LSLPPCTATIRVVGWSGNGGGFGSRAAPTTTTAAALFAASMYATDPPWL
jgi:hypothetical protein